MTAERDALQQQLSSLNQQLGGGKVEFQQLVNKSEDNGKLIVELKGQLETANRLTKYANAARTRLADENDRLDSTRKSNEFHLFKLRR